MREIEIQAHLRDREGVMKKLKAFLTSLGIAPPDIGVKRYDTQLLEKERGGV